jgi:hypothetical protein
MAFLSIFVPTPQFFLEDVTMKSPIRSLVLSVAVWAAAHGLALSQTAGQTSDAYAQLAGHLVKQQTASLQAMAGGNFSQMFAAMTRGFSAMPEAERKEMEAKLSPIMEKALRRQAEVFAAPEAQASLRAAMESAAREAYSVEEAKALADFYNSPIGASVLGKSGAMTTSTMQKITPEMTRIMTPIQQELMTEIMSTMKPK